MIIANSYITDLGNEYNLLPISVIVENNNLTQEQIIEYLPDTLAFYYRVVPSNFFVCDVKSLIRRKLKLVFEDNTIITIDFPEPFNTIDLEELKDNPDITSYETIGEQISQYRLGLILKDGL